MKMPLVKIFIVLTFSLIFVCCDSDEGLSDKSGGDLDASTYDDLQETDTANTEGGSLGNDAGSDDTNYHPEGDDDDNDNSDDDDDDAADDDDMDDDDTSDDDDMMDDDDMDDDDISDDDDMMDDDDDISDDDDTIDDDDMDDDDTSDDDDVNDDDDATVSCEGVECSPTPVCGMDCDAECGCCTCETGATFCAPHYETEEIALWECMGDCYAVTMCPEGEVCNEVVNPEDGKDIYAHCIAE